MPPVRTARYTPAALGDLDAIWEYTARVWSIEQAEAYLRDLFATVETLCRFPEMAPERSEISPPVRLHPARSHLIIYRVNPEHLEVIRVPQARQDWASLLRV